MDAWILRLLLLPAVMYFAGLVWYKCPPEKMNSRFGLRISKCLQDNKEAWMFSQKYFGKTMMILGIIFICLTWICVLALNHFFPGLSGLEAAQIAYTMFMVEILGLCFVSIVTRRVTKKRFAQ